jgi:RimJ/RimL family protein N-acetyltransferase
VSAAIAWGALQVIEPRAVEVAAHAAALAAAYNDPHTAALLGHTSALTVDDVREHYANLAARGGRGFLLFADDELAGDADRRGVADGAGEFAFLIAAPARQGAGLGTRFATMIHAAAFARMGLERIYAAVIPHNAASRRVFEKLGYDVDASAAATGRYGDDGDLVLRIERAAFEARHAAALAEIAITAR